MTRIPGFLHWFFSWGVDILCAAFIMVRQVVFILCVFSCHTIRKIVGKEKLRRAQGPSLCREAGAKV